METFLLSFCLSLDSFIVGINFGISKTVISLKAKIIMVLTSFSFTGAAMVLGFIAKGLMPQLLTKIVGMFILILIGLLTILKTVLNKTKADEERTLMSLGLKTLGITIRIIRNPEECDFDKSKVITGFEAVCLGFALSADSITVGFGSGILGICNIFLPVFISIFSILFITLGQLFINKLCLIKIINKEIIGIFSGILLIIIGILKLFI